MCDICNIIRTQYVVLVIKIPGIRQYRTPPENMNFENLIKKNNNIENFKEKLRFYFNKIVFLF